MYIDEQHRTFKLLLVKPEALRVTVVLWFVIHCIIVCTDNQNCSPDFSKLINTSMHGLHMIHLEKLLYRELQRKLHSREKTC